MTTLAEFITAVAGVSVAGVNRQYTYPPAALNSGDLPATYVTPPNGGRGGAFFAFDMYTDKRRSCDFVCAVEPVGQGTQQANFEAMIAMADAMEAGLDATIDAIGIRVDYTMETGTVDIAGLSYWAVIARITAHGDV